MRCVKCDRRVDIFRLLGGVVMCGDCYEATEAEQPIAFAVKAAFQELFDSAKRQRKKEYADSLPQCPTCKHILTSEGYPDCELEDEYGRYSF